MTLPAPPDPKEAAAEAAKKIDAEAREQLTLLIDELRLFSESTDEVSLERQAKILESSFVLMMSKYVNPKRGYYESEFRLALQAQSQCLDALKAQTVIRYMESLTKPPGIKILDSLPPPPGFRRSETE